MTVPDGPQFTGTEVLSWLQRASQLSATPHDSDQFHQLVLEAITGITGLELAFVTELDREAGVQRILASTQDDPGGPLARGTEGKLENALCVRAVDEKRFWTDDVRERWAEVADLYDLGTYVSVPIRSDKHGRARAMLCAGSKDSRPPMTELQSVFDVFARLLAERQHADEDLAEAKVRALDAERQLRERIEFAATTEHAMKGPLTVIEGWVEMLEADASSTRLSRDQRIAGFAAIRRATDRLSMQVEDLVTEARSTMIRGDSVHVDLRALAADVVESFHRDPPFVVLDGRPAVALADAISVRILLEHLLENVLSHTPLGTIATVQTDQDDDAAILRVSDDGPGLPEHIDPFEAFVSESGSSGLGLWIVQSIVASLHGSLEAETSEAGGAQFTIRLPLPPASD